MIMFVSGVLFGTLIGVATMAVFSINRGEKDGEMPNV